MFFFFQAEDGIRDVAVTGVQTCALPIFGAVAAGTEPDAQLAPGAVKGLAGDGLEPALTRPRPVTLYDLDSSTRIVSFGCDVVATRGQRVEQWDVPAVSDGYAVARDRIVAKVERLAAPLAGGPSGGAPDPLRRRYAPARQGRL